MKVYSRAAIQGERKYATNSQKNEAERETPYLPYKMTRRKSLAIKCLVWDFRKKVGAYVSTLNPGIIKAGAQQLSTTHCGCVASACYMVCFASRPIKRQHCFTIPARDGPESQPCAPIRRLGFSRVRLHLRSRVPKSRGNAR